MFEDIDPHDYDKVNDVNANGAFLCRHAALKVMRPPKTGTIINIVSLG
jgi:NAD(P)-dependent dehydrogenase (short-subunit alcohol dehydrogenase family)